MTLRINLLSSFVVVVVVVVFVVVEGVVWGFSVVVVGVVDVAVNLRIRIKILCSRYRKITY